MKILGKLFGKPAHVAEPHQPPADLVREARNHPGGWVYEISGKYDPDGAVPPHAIRGAWQVDQAGDIIPGSYQANPNFRANH